MRSFIYFSVLLFGLASCEKGEPEDSPLTGSWKPVENSYFQGVKERIQSAGCVYHDTLLFGMGFLSLTQDLIQNDLWLYTEEGWNRLPDFPGQKRIDPLVCMSQGGVFVTQGYALPSQAFKDIRRYDLRTGMWDSLSYEFPGQGRTGAISFELEGKLYLGAGVSIQKTGMLSDMYIFDPQQGWNSFFTERQAYSTVFKWEGEVYCCFGQDERGYITSHGRVDAQTGQGQSVAKGEAYTVRTDAHAFAIRQGEQEYVYLIGGKPKLPEAYDWCFRYNFQTKRTEKIIFPETMSVKAAFAIHNTAYIFDGKNVYHLLLPD